jgi:CysZ protein
VGQGMVTRRRWGGAVFVRRMLRAASTATSDLFEARLLRYVGLAALLGVLVFVGVWFGLEALVTVFAGEEGAWPTALAWLGALVTVVLAWFLFPGVMSACASLFLDRVAAAVERRHYPWLGQAPGLPWTTALGVSLRFLGLLLLVYLVLFALTLVAVVLLPPLSAVGWIVGTGWLLGLEYFELVALRWLTPKKAKALRARHGGELLAIGIVLAFLFTVPFVNLAVPVWATAWMVHRLQAWRGADARRPELPR